MKVYLLIKNYMYRDSDQNPDMTAGEVISVHSSQEGAFEHMNELLDKESGDEVRIPTCHVRPYELLP